MDYLQIYREQPVRYDAMVSAEDCDGALPALLTVIAPGLHCGRAPKPGGKLVVSETLGTGCTEPTPPPGLEVFQRWLEREWRLARRVLRTDYRFATVNAAAESMGFFFG